MGGAAICIEFTYGHDDRYMGMMRNDFHALYTMQLGGVIGGGALPSTKPGIRACQFGQFAGGAKR